jgi:hypothetical protein
LFIRREPKVSGIILAGLIPKEKVEECLYKGVNAEIRTGSVFTKKSEPFFSGGCPA